MKHLIAGAHNRSPGAPLRAWLTARNIRELYSLEIPWVGSAPPVLLGILLGGAGFLYHWGRGYQTGLVELAIITVGSLAVFVGGLKKMGRTWVPLFWSAALSPSFGKQVGADLKYGGPALS